MKHGRPYESTNGDIQWLPCTQHRHELALIKGEGQVEDNSPKTSSLPQQKTEYKSLSRDKVPGMIIYTNECANMYRDEEGGI